MSQSAITLWVRFAQEDGRVAYGRLAGGLVEECVGDPFAGGGPQAAVPAGRRHALEDVRLLAPCVPTKVVALWNNFHALGAKLGKPAPVHPLFLLKPGTSVIGPGDEIRRPPRYAGKIAYEGELGIVIGRRCAGVSVEQADDYILGYTCVNDVTAAELIAQDPNFPQWCRAKGFDTFSCIGPAIAAGLDWTAAHVVTTLDGVERQNYPIADMIFSPQEQVSRISGDMTLYPGDVIACGTSIGLGSMKDGATVCIAIAGVGELRNTLVA